MVTKVAMSFSSPVAILFLVLPFILVSLEICSNLQQFRVGRHLCDMFPIKNSLKQVDALSPLLFNCVLE